MIAMQNFNVTNIGKFSGHKGAVYALEACESVFYTGGADGYIVSWDKNNPDMGKLLVQVNRPVYSLLFHKDLNWLLCGTASGNLHVVDLTIGKEIRNIELHTNGIFDLQLIAGNLISCGGDGKVNVCNLPDLSIIKQEHYSNKSARALAFNTYNKHLAVAYSDYHIRIFLLPQMQVIEDLHAHTNSVFTVAYTRDGSELLSGGRDVQLKTWIVNNNYSLDIDIPAHTLHINHISFNPSGNFFVTVGMDKMVKIWETSTMQLLKVLDKDRSNGHLSSVNKCKWLNDTEFVTVSDDRTAILWKID